jgi:hypothetical protein
MLVIEELVFATDRVVTLPTEAPSGGQTPLAPEQESALRSAIEPLASLISTSSNPRGTLLHAMELLLHKLNGIDPTTADWLGRIPQTDR